MVNKNVHILQILLATFVIKILHIMNNAWLYDTQQANLQQASHMKV